MVSRSVPASQTFPAQSGLPYAEDGPAIAARIRAGDVRAFEQLFHAYYALLCNFALVYVKSNDTAKEIVQDVMLWVWEGRRALDVRGDVRAYLYVAVRHQALNWLRRERVVTRWATEAAADSRLAGVGQGPPSADRVLRQREIADALAQALAKLPERRRMAFVLSWQHGLTNAQTAEVMGISVKGVEATLAKALDTLREILAPLRVI